LGVVGGGRGGRGDAAGGTARPPGPPPRRRGVSWPGRSAAQPGRGGRPAEHMCCSCQGVPPQSWGCADDGVVGGSKLPARGRQTPGRGLMSDDGPQDAGDDVLRSVAARPGRRGRPSEAAAAGLVVRSSVAARPGCDGKPSRAAAAGHVVRSASRSIVGVEASAAHSRAVGPDERSKWSCRSRRAPQTPPPHTRPEPDAGRRPAECR